MNYTYPQLNDVLKFTKSGMSIKVSGFKTNFVAKELLKKIHMFMPRLKTLTKALFTCTIMRLECTN